MNARSHKVGYSYDIVTGTVEEGKTGLLQYVTVVEHVNNGRKTALLYTAEGLFLESCNTALFVSGGGILVDNLVVSCIVILEIVYKRNCLFEDLTALTSLHKKMLCAEHFGYLCEYTAAAHSDELVGESANERICGNAAVSVASSTLKAYSEAGYGHGSALKGARVFLELLNNADTLRYLVLVLLRDKESYASFVYLAEHLFEHVDVVVLTAETEHKHTCRVGVVDHTLEYLLGYLLVISELRAAEGVREVECACSRSYSLGNLVYASYGIDDPYLVSDTYVTVFTDVAHKGASLLLGGELIALRLVDVLEVTREICLHVVRVYVLACFDILGRVTDGVAVFDYILAFFYVLKGIFVTVGEIDIYVVKTVYLHFSISSVRKEMSSPKNSLLASISRTL